MPIQTLAAKTYESRKDDIAEVLAAEVARFKKVQGDTSGIWTNYSVCDMLPTPTPASLEMGQLMYTPAGFGRAHAALGLPYDAAMSRHLALDTFCGRAFLNLVTNYGMFAIPFELHYEAIKKEPHQAVAFDPPIKPSLKSPGAWLRLPYDLLKFIPRYFNRRSSHHHQYYSETLPSILRHVEEEERLDVKMLSDSDLLDKIGALIAHLLEKSFFSHQVAEYLQFIHTSNLRRALRWLRVPNPDNLLRRLLTGLEGNPNTRMTLDLWRLATGEVTLAQFLNSYGHRALLDVELALPRWREDPTPVLRMADMLRRSGISDPLRKFEKQKTERQRAENELRGWLGTGGRRALRGFLLSELRYCHIYTEMREATNFYMFMEFALVRQALIELGNRYGIGDDIFYLFFEEMRRLVTESGLANLAASRKREREILLEVELPSVIFSDTLEDALNARRPEPVNELSGVPVSSGKAVGRARVVRDFLSIPVLNSDEILVTFASNPCWTPAFLIPRGLVVETGGLLAHGAMLAREMGLPTVVCVGGATQIIQEGQYLSVDADQGKVSILKGAALQEADAEGTGFD